MQDVKKPVRFILSGVGQRGKQWGEVAQRVQDAKIVAYVDIDADNRAWAAETLGAEKSTVFDSFETAVHEVEADAAILAVPPMARYEHSMLALDAGLAIIAEKPLTVDLDETIEISRRAAQLKLPLVSGYQFRYLTVTQAARRILASGEIGSPNLGRYTYWTHRDGLKPGGNRYPLVMDHPMLLEQSIHHLDLIRYVYDSEVKTIWCKTQNPPWSRYADDATAMAIMEMENGMTVAYLGTWMAQSRVREVDWRTDCDRGAIRQAKLYSDLYIAHEHDEEWRPADVVPDVAYYDDTYRLLKGFVDDLAAGKDPQPNAADNLRTMALVFACIESTASGEQIEMQEFYRRHGMGAAELAV